MAECHPVGFQWVMEAKARGAKLIHVDPRFTRTSALADLHVPIRAGSDIAFLGGIVNYVLQHEKYFRDYVLACTNAAVIVTETFADTEDLDGVFSGLDREHRVYDFHTWQYEGLEVQAASGERDAEYEDTGGTRRSVRPAGVRRTAQAEPASRRENPSGTRRYNRASADADGTPWSERKALVWWDAENARWTGHDVPDFPSDKSPYYRPPDDATGPEALAGTDPSIMQADGKAWLFAPAGLVDGPLPAHYEPQESPFRNPLYGQSSLAAHTKSRGQLIRRPAARSTSSCSRSTPSPAR
jgi:hypothetical protein